MDTRDKQSSVGRAVRSRIGKLSKKKSQKMGKEAVWGRKWVETQGSFGSQREAGQTGCYVHPWENPWSFQKDTEGKIPSGVIFSFSASWKQSPVYVTPTTASIRTEESKEGRRLGGWTKQTRLASQTLDQTKPKCYIGPAPGAAYLKAGHFHSPCHPLRALHLPRRVPVVLCTKCGIWK